MKKKEYDCATELLKKIDEWTSLIDDINGDGVIDVGIIVPVEPAREGRRPITMERSIRNFIDDVTYREICKMVKKSVKRLLDYYNDVFAEL